jgi:hypothetical protein
MTKTIRVDTLDLRAVSTVTEIILPGTLANGLIACYLFDQGVTARSLNNYAPGGTQGASFVGTPTANADGTLTLGPAGYVQTPIAETVEMTIAGVCYSLAPVAGEFTALWGNQTGDTSRSGNPVCGMYLRDTTATTQPDGKLNSAAYFAAPGATPVVAAITVFDVPAYRTPNLIYMTASTIVEKTFIGNITTGTSVGSTLQTQPHQPNGSTTFRIGSNPSSVWVGTSNHAMNLMWNRVLTTAENALLKVMCNGYVSPYSYTV